MTAYQFVFYTFYQLFRARSSDRMSVLKAGIAVAVLQILLAIAILAAVDLALRRRDIPPPWLCTTFALVNALVVYAAFDWRARWKMYAAEFRRYSRRRVLIGRALVISLSAATCMACFGLVWYITVTLPAVR